MSLFIILFFGIPILGLLITIKIKRGFVVYPNSKFNKMLIDFDLVDAIRISYVTRSIWSIGFTSGRINLYISKKAIHIQHYNYDKPYKYGMTLLVPNLDVLELEQPLKPYIINNIALINDKIKIEVRSKVDLLETSSKIEIENLKLKDIKLIKPIIEKMNLDINLFKNNFH